MATSFVKGIDYPGICVVFLCHDGAGNIVMHRRSARARDEHGKWDIGGGGLRHGERIEDCLAREIKEEYCADLITYDFLGYRDIHRVHEGAATHWIGLDFIVQVNRSQVTLGDSDKMDEIGWFSMTTLPPDDERHSQAPVFWQKYERQLAAVLTPLPQPV